MLPKNGNFSDFNKLCPLCSYGVIKISGDKEYTICPKCYSNPPEIEEGVIII